MTTSRPARDRAAAALAEFLDGRRTAVLTGAGVSTDSGIPDYRSPGRPVRTPMTWQEFAGSEERRRRYWAGAAIGWPRFDAARPNAGHRALAALERQELVTGLATQNIDGLHLAAGSERVIELHGHLRAVRCLDCGAEESRAALLQRMRDENPRLAHVDRGVEGNPDGDAEIPPALVDAFRVPACRICGGMLAPRVVMFGQHVDAADTAAAAGLVDGAEALLVAGSSMAVNTGVRLVHRARRAGLPVAVVNRGATRVDADAALRLEGGTSELLGDAARLLGVMERHAQ